MLVVVCYVLGIKEVILWFYLIFVERWLTEFLWVRWVDRYKFVVRI